MGFFDSIMKNLSAASPIGFGSLKSASESSEKGNKPGVYLLKLNGDIKKVGSAAIGVQKRMQQYYGLNSSCGLTGCINEENRDKIKVKWQSCSKRDCEELESKLNDKYEDSNSMEWSERRPHSSSNNAQLII